MRVFEKNIRKVEPYVPGEQPQHKVIKLNTNENPYPPAPGVREALMNMDTDRLRLYPDPKAEKLVRALAIRYGVKDEQIFVGVGSDDVLAMCFLTFFNSDKPILFPDVTYSFYKVWAELYGIPYECPAINNQFCLVKEDYYKENGGIIFPNPNAPTSIYMELDEIEDILQHNPESIVIIDEAYIDFADAPSAVELVDKYDNLIVVQTFSKSRALAGMRIGYAISNPALIKYLNDVKYSFNSYTINQTSLVCGVAALRDQAYFEGKILETIVTREWTKKELYKLGFIFPNSKTNFLLVKHPNLEARELFEALKEDGIYVRYLGGERIKKYLRISIGTPEEMESLVFSLKKYVLSKTIEE